MYALIGFMTVAFAIFSQPVIQGSHILVKKKNAALLSGITI